MLEYPEKHEISPSRLSQPSLYLSYSQILYSPKKNSFFSTKTMAYIPFWSLLKS